VDASNLTPEQLAALKAQVGRVLRYLNRLRERMERRGWRLDDPAYRATFEAWNKVHSLSVHLHYASCPPGTVCNPPPPTTGGG